MSRAGHAGGVASERNAVGRAHTNPVEGYRRNAPPRAAADVTRRRRPLPYPTLPYPTDPTCLPAVHGRARRARDKHGAVGWLAPGQIERGRGGV